MAMLNAVWMSRRLAPILFGWHADAFHILGCLTQYLTETEILHFAWNLAGLLDCSSMVDGCICINALVDHELVVVPADLEMVILVGIFYCPNAIMEITDWHKVCISVIGCV